MATHFRFPTGAPFDAGALTVADRRRRYDPLILRHFRSWGRPEEETGERLDAFWTAWETNALPSQAPSPSDEREFMAGLLRSFLERFPPVAVHGPSVESDLEQALTLIEGLDIYQAKCAFLLLCNYPKDWIGTVLKVGTVQVYSTQERLGRQQTPVPKFGLAHRMTLDRRRRPAEVSVGHLSALIDGRLAWDDKERVEAACISHLELLQDLVVLEESGFFLRSAS